jgi:hypothetical protein
VKYADTRNYIGTFLKKGEWIEADGFFDAIIPFSQLLGM